MEEASNHELEGDGSSNDGGTPAKGYTRQDQEKQPAIADDIDTSTHASLAAMSTDDVSSMGETQMSYYTGNTTGSRRKRKDDCSESRCTVTSEESARSRSRRRRCRSLMPDQQRWLDRIDRKAATSHAPIRPNRSDDDSFLLLPPGAAAAGTSGEATSGSTPGTRFTAAALSAESNFNFQRSMSHTLTRPGPGVLHSSRGPQHEDCRSEEATKDARDVARCQSMSLPPVRPTRTRDDSKTDLMKDDSKADLMKNDSKTELMKDDSKPHDQRKETPDEDEIDPDMFVRLLRGQEVMAGSLSPPNLATARSGGSQTDPPKKPRRRSDADLCMDGKRKRHTPTLTRFNTVASTRDYAAPSCRSCPHKCQSLRDSCSHAISPKPPAKPFRTIDDSILESAPGMPKEPPDLSLPKLPNVPRVSEETTTLEGKMASDNDSDQSRQRPLEMSSSNRMDLEQSVEGGAVFVEKNSEQEEEDETEVSIPASVKEYDHDLFERLLHGESYSKAATNGGPSDHHVVARGIAAEQSQPPPPLLPRVSSSSGNAITATLPGYNRFDNSASCAMPEHMEGAMKSSHPPMRPRRSFDEGMIVRKGAVSLANAAAVACVAGASPSPAIMAEPAKRICIIGGKRRYCRPSRRATLALASELPPSSEKDNAAGAHSSAPNDPTQEANLMNSPTLHESSDAFTEIDERDEYVQHVDPIAASDRNDGSYQRILPARRHRRVVRRFTMPSKGGGELTSPQAKKRRIGRSLSCRSPQDETTPAA